MLSRLIIGAESFQEKFPNWHMVSIECGISSFSFFTSDSDEKDFSSEMFISYTVTVGSFLCFSLFKALKYVFVIS